MLRNKTATQHNFAVVPSSEVPRSRFPMRQTRKMAFDASELVPIMCEEVLPGDVWQHTESVMARLATPIAPVVDDCHLETFYFFVPNRIAWSGDTRDNAWEQFITGADTTLTIPKIRPVTAGPTADVLAGGLLDHFGILPQTLSAALPINALPVFGYFTIWNEWFRDQNLQEPYIWDLGWTVSNSDGITNDGNAWYQEIPRANKRHDYFTASLPWAQKGADVTLPLGSVAPVVTSDHDLLTGSQFALSWSDASAGNKVSTSQRLTTVPTTGYTHLDTGGVSGQGVSMYPSNLYADLATATAATINSLRLAITTQQLLEKDARGGSRYVEQLMVHFRTRSPDFRLQRPEYLGGTKTPITVNPIAQTAAYDAAPADAASAVGNLGAEMHVSSHKRTFTYAATEHGYIIGVCVVRATPTYQQGTRRHWLRDTRLDYYFPTFANIGEQAVTTQEIYQTAGSTWSNDTWGYQERYAEYRYTPNEITGVLRSTAAQPLDWWHYAEEFGTEPALNASFITDKTQETLARSLATAPSEQWSAQIIMDIMHTSNVARLMPTYGVPGLTRF
jgi:hypothetical protein